MRLPLAKLATLSLLPALAACGASDPKALTDQGTAALHSGDARGAIGKLDAALARMDASHHDFLRASLTRCLALGQLEPERAKDEFLALARARSDVVREQDFAAMAQELVKRGAIPTAAEIADAGMKLFPGSPGMQSVRDLVGNAAKKAKDPDALKKLQGLGYAGGDQ